MAETEEAKETEGHTSELQCGNLAAQEEKSTAVAKEDNENNDDGDLDDFDGKA